MSSPKRDSSGNREQKTWIPRGQGLAEYAFILGMIAIVAIIALIFLGGQVSKITSKQDTQQSANPSASVAAVPEGFRVSVDASGARLVVSGPNQPDGETTLVRMSCDGTVDAWKPAGLVYDDGWISVVKPTASDCTLQAGVIVDGAVKMFGEVPLPVPGS